MKIPSISEIDLAVLLLGLGAGYMISSSGVLDNVFKSYAVSPTTAMRGLCTSEGGKWNGICCSCPNKQCRNKCPTTGTTPGPSVVRRPPTTRPVVQRPPAPTVKRPPQQQTLAPRPSTPPPSRGGGSAATGRNVYKVVGPIAPTSSTRINTAADGDPAVSHRDNQGFACNKCNRETTWIFKPGSAGDWSIKMGSHGGGSDNASLIEFCQWHWDGSAKSGGAGWRCEGPHNKYGKFRGGSGSAPNMMGKSKAGLKGISWPLGPNNMHHEIWYDPTGSGSNWGSGPIAIFDGSPSDCNPISCPVPDGEDNAHCQDTFRIDEDGTHQFLSSSTVEIAPGQRA